MGATTSTSKKQRILRKHMGDSKWTDFLYYQLDITNPTLLRDFRMQQWKELADGQTTTMEFVSGVGEDLLEELTYVSRGPKADAILIWTVVNQYPDDLREFLVAAATKELKPVVSPAIANSVYGKEFVPEIKYMQPAAYFDYTAHLKDKPFTITPKISGVTGIIYKSDVETKIWSVSGARLIGFEHIVEDLQNMNMTGVVFIGQMVHRDTMDMNLHQRSMISRNTVKADDKSDLIFYISDILTTTEFDRQTSKKTFEERRQYIDTNIVETENIKILPVIYRGSDLRKIPKVLRQQREENNIEAVYINIDEAYYAYSNSQNYLMRKEINSADLMIIDYIEDEDRPEHLKGFVVDYKGTEVLVKDGFTTRERKFYWYYREHYLGWIMGIQYHKEIEENQSFNIVSPVFMELKDIGTPIRYRY